MPLACALMTYFSHRQGEALIQVTAVADGLQDLTDTAWTSMPSDFPESYLIFGCSLEQLGTQVT